MKKQNKPFESNSDNNTCDICKKEQVMIEECNQCGKKVCGDCAEPDLLDGKGRMICVNCWEKNKKGKSITMIDLTAQIHAFNIIGVMAMHMGKKIEKMPGSTEAIEAVRDYLKQYFSDSVNIKGTKE